MVQRQMLVLMPLLFVTPNSIAGIVSYDCEVTHVYDLTEQGTLRISGFEKTMKGSKLTVSRTTGEIAGQVLPTLSAKSFRVVNEGTTENSFKAVADFGKQYQLLEVQEFREGNVKPFVASSMGGAGIVTGVCK